MSAKTVKNPPVAPAFTASAELRSDLQRALVDITALSLVGKQIHWNLVGPNFRDLHLNLDEVVDIAREGSDELAERMRAINAYPDARPATVAEETSVPVAPEGSVITSDAVDYIVAAINAVTRDAPSALRRRCRSRSRCPRRSLPSDSRSRCR